MAFGKKRLGDFRAAATADVLVGCEGSKSRLTKSGLYGSDYLIRACRIRRKKMFYLYPQDTL